MRWLSPLSEQTGHESKLQFMSRSVSGHCTLVRLELDDRQLPQRG